MSETEDGDFLEFEKVGDDYALVRTRSSGERTEIILSEANVSFLNRLVPLTLRKILARHSSLTAQAQGVETNLFVPLARLLAAPDLHLDVVLLTMIDEYDNQTGYAVPLEIAKPLVDTLHNLSQEIEAAKRSRKLQ